MTRLTRNEEIKYYWALDLCCWLDDDDDDMACLVNKSNYKIYTRFLCVQKRNRIGNLIWNKKNRVAYFLFLGNSLLFLENAAM